MDSLHIRRTARLGQQRLGVGDRLDARTRTDPARRIRSRRRVSKAALVSSVLAGGTAIAAPAGTMVTSVIGVSWRHGTVRVSLDTGAFHGLIEALESGRKLRFPVSMPGAGNRMLVPCSLTGPSCDSQDTILDRVWLPAPNAGDRVLIGDAGAYTTCYSGRSAFNGYPAPAIRVVSPG